MSETTTLKFGNRTLRLEKSRDLIAVRSRGVPGEAMWSKLERTAKSATVPSGRVGRFGLLRITGEAAEMESSLDALRADPNVEIGSHVYFSGPDQVPFVPSGEIYVAFRPGTSAAERQQLLAACRLSLVEARSDRELIVRTTASSENPIKSAAKLQESPLVETAEPDLETEAAFAAVVVPTDPLLGDQWHLRNVGTHHGTSVGFRAGADARVIDAWMQLGSLGSKDVVLAMIDDGFDLTHPDIGGSEGLSVTWDFTRDSADPSPEVGDWHGTACAGVALGRANQRMILGVAPGVRFMPIRWGRNLSDREIERWFWFARDNGAWVVSCSWSARAANFPLSSRASAAIADCARNGRGGLGCVICFSAGNEDRDIDDPASGSVNGFAIHPDVLAIAASTSMDERADYSNRGRRIAVCAPSSGAGGWGITTSDVTGTRPGPNGTVLPRGYSPGDITNDFGGTSSACPVVAGVAALILSVNPALTAKEVRERIKQTARRIGSPASYDTSGHSEEYGYGCVDAVAAVRGDS